MTRADLIKIAVAAINEVMDKYQREKGDRWTRVSGDEHLKHAFIHIDNLTDLTTTKILGKKIVENDKEMLTHALTRIAMALCVAYYNDYEQALVGGNVPYKMER